MLAKVAHNNSKADKRASLVASKAKWSRVDEQPTPRLSADGRAGNYKQDSVQQWLMSSCQEQVKSDPDLDASEPLKRQASGEDDLVLGIEASLYGRNPELKTAEEVPRSPQAVPPLTRWNSLTSAVSAQSGALSVMDVLNLWHDDPEELLLELGFGSEEPDISARIPARFINHQSRAQGINIQVFLEAHKNRLDLENPDVSSRFRQLEVLQQVTSAFSALVPATPPTPAPAVKLSPASRERRRRLGMLFRRASKKTLSMNQGQQSPPADPSANQEPDLSDRRPALKHSRPGPPENAGLTPLVEEQSPNASQDACDPPAAGPPPLPGESPRPQLRRDPPCISPRSPLRRKSPGDMKSPESFEIEEIHSFDEGSAVRSAAELGESAEARFLRTSSCQSDSSGFLEEPFIPCLSQQASPVPELLKALHNLSGDSTDSQITVKESTDIPYRMDSPTSVKEMTDIPNRMDSPTTVKESTDIPYRMDSPTTVKESTDIPYKMDSLTSVKEMADIPNRMDSPTTVKESTDIPYGMDSPTNVKESTDIPYRMDSPTSVKESADVPYRMDSPTTVKESADIPYRMDSPTTVKESTDISYRMDSPSTVKEMADIPNRMDSPTTVKESTDIPYRMGSPTTVKEMADIPYKMDSPTTVKESTDIPYKMDSPTTIKESTDIPFRMDSPTTVKEMADISNGMDSPTSVKESADVPYRMDSPTTVKESADIPYRMDSPSTIKEMADIPNKMDSQTTVKESTDIPYRMGSPTTVKEMADIPYKMDSPTTIKESTDIPYRMDSPKSVKEMADIPNRMDNPTTVKESTDTPYRMDSPTTVKEMADIPNRMDSLTTVKEITDIPYKMDSPTTVKESTDIPYSMVSPKTVKEIADIPYSMDSQLTVKESTDIPYSMDSPKTVKEIVDIPYSMDSPTTVKESADVPYRMDSQLTVKESAGIPFITDSQTIVKGNVDISYSKDIHKTVEYSCDVPNNTGSSITVKKRADIPSNYSLITVNKCADIPYIMNTSITVNAYADVPYSTDSPIALIDCADIPYKYNMIIVNDSADIPDGMDSQITVKESADIPYRMDSLITVKESADIPYNTENWIRVNEVSDLPCNMDSEGLEKKKLDLPYRTESGISLKEDSGIPFVSDSRSLLKENSSQGAADSPQTAGLETNETTDREEVEISQNPVVQMKTGPVPSQTGDDGEDPGAPRASFGEIKTGSGVKESASPEEEESLLCSKSKNSLQPQGGIAARRRGSEWAQGWLEESTDAAFPHREESETDVGAESFRPDWASFGSSKSVSVQMRSSLPSVSQTTRRRCPAPAPNLRREIADAMAAAAASSRGQGRKLSQGKPRKRSASLDTGRTWEEEEGEEEVGRWEAGMIAGTRCCCVCDHRCSCCSWHTHCPTGERTSAGLPLLHQSASRSSPFTFSLDELEGMVRCMRRFRGVLEDVEEQLQEQEAQVYSDFSDLDREDAASVQALRAEVKREAELLETQLTELAQHCDAGITAKMQRLLDEQSQLCMQLRLPSEAPRWGPAHGRQATPPGPVSAVPGYLSGRCVATQCCLLPDLLVSGSSLSADLLPGTQCPSPPPEGALTPARATTATRRNPPNKQDVLAFAGFFQSLKDSLRHSVHSDCLE